MKLVTFVYKNITRVGALLDNEIVDGLGQKKIPLTMLEFLAAGQSALTAMQHLIDSQQV
ncbi:MAG: fumarylacetoacetate hydrolase, partial [Gammaproteobacteria bacterium]|nr:fumarylacetoacetate hydrolase [Gammaproteobacteria bacterium]